MKELTEESKKLLETVKIKLKDPVFMKKVKAQILADFAEYLYRTPDDVLREAVLQKMEKGGREHGAPPTVQTGGLSVIQMEIFDEHTDLIGWYFVYLNATYAL